MHEDSYDDDSYSASYSLDDIASHCEKLGLSSIYEDVESHKSPQKQRDEPTAKFSDESTNDSYSVDDDFTSSSKQGKNGWNDVASSSPDSPKQCDGTTSQHDEPNEEFLGEEESASLPIPINIPQQHGNTPEKCVHQENINERKQGHLGTNDNVTRIDEHLDAVSSDSFEQTPAQKQTKRDIIETDDYEYIGEVELTRNENTTPMHSHCNSNGSTKQQKEPKEPKYPSEEASKLQCQDAQTQTKLKSSIHRVHKPRTAKLKPASFVPRCAYALTKSMKIQRGEIEIKQEEPTKVRRYSKQRLEQLAKPVKHHIYEKENIQPESSSTTHKSKKKCLEYDADDGGNFLDRMESMERQRQHKLVRAAAEALYVARVDKKVCSNCGTVQSYDEMDEERTKCQNDGCKNGKHYYQPPTLFVLKKFEQRMERSTQRRSLILDRVEEERRSSIIHTSQRMSRRQKALQEKVSKEGNDFNTRMTNDIEARKKKIHHLAEHRVELLSKEYTFAPKLNVAERLIRHRKGGWDSLAKPLRRYTEEYQPPKESRKKKKKRRRKKPLESAW